MMQGRGDLDTLSGDARLPVAGVSSDPNVERMIQMILGFWVSQIVYAVARYSIADELAKGPATAAHIAEQQATHPDATFRLLRACASLGLVTADAQMQFASTSLLATLRRDAPGSLRGFALASGAPGFWRPWGRLIDAVQTGERQTVAALGKELWDYYAGAPAEAEAFTNNMNGMTEVAAREAVLVIDTWSSMVAVDVGGAGGVLLHALMEANSKLNGILLDLPNVIEQAKADVRWHGMEQRFSAVGGNFFESVPRADLYLLKWILHDWDDASCVQILRNCSQAMHQGGRVIVIEFALDQMNQLGLAPLMDLCMMIVTGGRERTVDEYSELFAAAGLRLVKATPINNSQLIIMEAVRV